MTTGSGDGEDLPPFTYAFQPIVDATKREIISYEALVRGPNGESAGAVLALVTGGALERLDRAGRLVAVSLAGELGLSCSLNLNVLPQNVRSSDTDLDALLRVAGECGIGPERLVLEVTEGEAIGDAAAFARAIDEYRGAGVRVAIDDFGAGYAGLNLLADFQPDVIKLDMHLIRNIESRGPRQSIVHAIIAVCRDLGIDVVAEGVESPSEFEWLDGAGVYLFQGYLFARPGLAQLAPATYPR
ncbi:MAG: EAL domain-containing protein [Gemmatimonadaceae bacterium]